VDLQAQAIEARDKHLPYDPPGSGNGLTFTLLTTQTALPTTAIASTTMRHHVVGLNSENGFIAA